MGNNNVEVPTGLGATVSISRYPHKPGYVLTLDGWRGLHSGEKYSTSYIANMLRNGARVLCVGVRED